MAKQSIATLERLIEVAARALRKERQVLDLYRDTARWAPTELTETLFQLLIGQAERHVSRLNDTLQVLFAKLEEAKLSDRKRRRSAGLIRRPRR
jgi:rubrerythrin